MRAIVGSALFTNNGVDVDAVRQFSDAVGRESRWPPSMAGEAAWPCGWSTTLDLLVKDAIAPLQRLWAPFSPR